ARLPRSAFTEQNFSFSGRDLEGNSAENFALVEAEVNVAENNKGLPGRRISHARSGRIGEQNGTWLRIVDERRPPMR
ncbi:MAG: hypothetical protein WAN13_01430, partial [Candidatus Acidiferrales bacterium]